MDSKGGQNRGSAGIILRNTDLPKPGDSHRVNIECDILEEICRSPAHTAQKGPVAGQNRGSAGIILRNTDLPKPGDSHRRRRSVDERFSFHTIEEALTDLKEGKVVIVVDDEDRENEGDFIALADKATRRSLIL